MFCLFLCVSECRCFSACMKPQVLGGNMSSHLNSSVLRSPHLDTILITVWENQNNSGNNCLFCFVSRGSRELVQGEKRITSVCGVLWVRCSREHAYFAVILDPTRIKWRWIQLFCCSQRLSLTFLLTVLSDIWHTNLRFGLH